MLKGQRLHDQAERLTVEAETMSANLENAASGAVIESESSLILNTDSYKEILPPRREEAAVVYTFLRAFFVSHNVFTYLL